jgi:pyruvate kinase
MNPRTQIVATIGPASGKPEVLQLMITNGMDIARINFAWSDSRDGGSRIDAIRAAALHCGRSVSIVADLPGPRVQLEAGHTYDSTQAFSITPHDEEVLHMCAEKKVEYAALSFVGTGDDIARGREIITKYGGSQKIIAKIERAVAVKNLDSIIAVSDAVMVARGDLGSEVPLEEIPFIQKTIIAKANAAAKPVIVATQMMLSMVEHQEPTRAEVTDVEAAVMDGADAVMLSEETASGRYPAEAVAMMERIIIATGRHETRTPNLL